MVNDPANKLTYYTALVEFEVAQNDLATARKNLAEVRKLNPKTADDLVEAYPQLKP